MTIARLTAALADRYRIERELGAGGMATVYLAQDLKHHRPVAVKVLHPDLAAALGAERFLAEIRTTANLQHPHILPLHDSGEAGGFLFYVMPYIEGETLRARLEREKQLPISDAVRLATEVAGALDYAHRHRVVHRDIKPENILLHDGSALVADFGIALAVTAAGGSRMTQTGMSLGTPQYMSPEQALGERAIDARADIYALGCVLYEMLIGNPPYTGATVQAIVAKVLSERPTPPRSVRDTVPPVVEEAVLTALAKLPADRFATAAEFALALKGNGDTSSRGRYPSSAAIPAAASPKRRLGMRELTAWVLATLATAAFAVGFLRAPPIPEAPVVRAGLELPPGERAYGIIGSVAVSPAGDRLAYATVSASGQRTMVRRTSELVGHEVAAGTLSNLAFSPDGRWLLYTEGNEIGKIPVDGGSRVPIGSIPSNPRGLRWLPNDTIVGGSGFGLWKIPASGGTFHEVRAPGDSASTSMWFPLLLQNGTGVIATSGTSFFTSRLALAPLPFGTTTVLPIPAVAPLGVLGGYLLYQTIDGVLMAVPFDSKRLRVTGDPIQVQDSVWVTSAGGGHAALSESGTLLYFSGQVESQLVLATGGRADRTLIKEPRNYVSPRFSPDGRRVAVTVVGRGGSDIWVYDLPAQTFTRLTTDGGNGVPEWSPDGARILFRSTGDDKITIVWMPADGSGKAEVLYQPDEPVNEAILSPDGQWLLYRTAPGGRHSRDIFAVPLAGDRKPVPLVTGPAREEMPRLSPDGRWLAYDSDESGRVEIYVRPFPGSGARVQVSDRGGSEPLWARSGRALSYRTSAGVVSVAVTTGTKFSIGERRTVLTGEYVTDLTHPNYDVSPDGSQFLMLKQSGAEPKLMVVHNWGRELREKLAKGKQ